MKEENKKEKNEKPLRLDRMFMPIISNHDC